MQIQSTAIEGKLVRLVLSEKLEQGWPEGGPVEQVMVSLNVEAQPEQSLAFVQLATIYRLRDIVDAEIQRLRSVVDQTR